jgi:hypothetical protein
MKSSSVAIRTSSVHMTCPLAPVPSSVASSNDNIRFSISPCRSVTSVSRSIRLSRTCKGNKPEIVSFRYRHLLLSPTSDVPIDSEPIWRCLGPELWLVLGFRCQPCSPPLRPFFDLEHSRIERYPLHSCLCQSELSVLAGR